MTYTMISVTARGFMLVLITAIQLVYIYCIIRMIHLKKFKWDLLFTVVMTLICFVFLQLMTMIQQKDFILYLLE